MSIDDVIPIDPRSIQVLRNFSSSVKICTDIINLYSSYVFLPFSATSFPLMEVKAHQKVCIVAFSCSMFNATCGSFSPLNCKQIFKDRFKLIAADCLTGRVDCFMNAHSECLNGQTYHFLCRK